MHRVLYTQEILLNIFKCTYPAWRSSFNPDLVALARTCRVFHEPALNVLWAELDNLTPLIRCLPQDLWSVEIVKIGGSEVRCYSFHKPLRDADWNRLRSYTHRVRAVRSTTKSRALVVISFLRTLCYSPTAIPLFPNLQQLKWDNPSTGFLPFVHQLAGPKLTHLSFVAPGAQWDAPALSIIGSLRKLCPNLKHVALLPSKKNINSADTISGLLCHWTELRTVRCHFVNIDALSHLSCLSSLETLNLSLDKRLQDQMKGVSTLKFSKLKSLSLVSDSLLALSKFFGQLHLPLISFHDVEVQTCPKSETLKSYLAALRNSCAHDRLLYLQINQLEIGPSASVDSQPHRLTSVDFQPLTFFVNLSNIKINVAGSVDIDDSGLLILASSWPSLELLRINEEHGWRSSGGITPRGFAQLFEKCKSLHSLAIVIDTRDFTNIPEDCQSSGDSQFHIGWGSINVLDSVIEASAVTALAAFFSDVAPSLSSFDAWMSNTMSRRPEAVGYKSLWEEVRTQAKKIEQVREQERRRYVE
ncbi:hypothetical protein HYDPIDRAFT_26864 [Hydnomerulius pinastri MD-312]|nr:hypothetical protein HYDPIDRAFT_26864 [Hydnomerulius pinastri MD-312]